MVEIIYGENRMQADLAGKSVAEVRELYKSEFNIPDRAQASLNSQPLEKELEPEAKLYDCDQLSFKVKSRKNLVLLGAFLLTLAITGGLFAYTYTTMTTTITVTGGTVDFAEVSANNTPPISYSVLGKRLGKIDPNTLFNIDTNAASPDIEVQVYLSNPDQLSSDYSFWHLRLALQDSDNASMDMEGITKVLSLHNPMVSFTSDNNTPYTAYVQNKGGSYRAFPSGWVTPKTPQIFCKVVQRSAP